MDALIAELERAKKGSMELDTKIMEILFADEIARGITPEVMRYSRSFDAALTLAPEGHRCSFDIPGAEGGRNHATVVKYSQVSEAVNLKASPEEIIELWNHSYAATPALALCIASLKARQAMKEVA